MAKERQKTYASILLAVATILAGDFAIQQHFESRRRQAGDQFGSISAKPAALGSRLARAVGGLPSGDAHTTNAGRGRLDDEWLAPQSIPVPDQFVVLDHLLFLNLYWCNFCCFLHGLIQQFHLTQSNLILTVTG